jgi:protein-L-isoaspartate O-methyltransferase
VLWADGLALGPEAGQFDRILAHGAPPSPAAFAGLLRAGGVMVAGRRGENSTYVARYVRDEDGGLAEEAICAGRLASLIPGLSLVL